VGPRGSRVRMVVSELRGEKIDIIPWNTEPARFLAKALSPARVREVYIDDETKESTVIVPEDQLALAIGKEGLNARLAARLTGWKVDIQSEAEFAAAEAEAAFGGGEAGDDFSGRCAAILSNGKRCPNAAIPGTRFCGIPAHTALADREAAGETIETGQAVPIGGAEEELPAEGEEVAAEAQIEAEAEMPMPEPSDVPSPEPSPMPTGPEPSESPAPAPSPMPTGPEPSESPAPAPTEIPSPEPTEQPAPEPATVPPVPAAEDEESLTATGTTIGTPTREEDDGPAA
jgi:transcription termination/antitermination protein NusA